MLFNTIIEAPIVSEHLGSSSWRIIDSRFALSTPDKGYRDYQNGHIPGAVYAHLDNDLSGPTGLGTGRHPLPTREDFTATLAKWGIRPDQQVVVYDDANGVIAGRLWWMLSRWARHPAVAVLDGGFTRWQARGLPVESAVPLIPGSGANKWDFDDNAWNTTDMVMKSLADRSVLLVDARNPERYRGEKEPIDPRAGHIPRAMNVPLGGNLDSDGCFRGSDELRDRFRAVLGGREPEDMVHMCGSGVSACHNLLGMEIAGLTGSKLYVGSWSEWIADPTRPVAVGD